MDWSEQQNDIFDWFGAGQGNLAVRARAGSGKTTTVLEGIGRATDHRILLAAFNKRIAEELKSRLRNPRAQALTLHSLGFRAVRQAWGGVGLDPNNDRRFDLAKDVCGEQAPKEVIGLVAKLHTHAREIAPLAEGPEDLVAIADDHDCEPDRGYVADGFDLSYVTTAAYMAMEKAAEVEPPKGIDFADMIYLPLRNRWLRPQYDLVVVDEAQDMAHAQLLLALGVAAGRVAVVGDDRQAIYAFRGADSNALDRLKRELRAAELGLKTTYRCGHAIVEHARKIVEDFFAGPSNPPGEVIDATRSRLIEQAQPGDFVLSRTNAALAPIALKLLKAGRRCRIAGRDIGASIIALVRKIQKKNRVNEISDFEAALDSYEQQEIERLSKRSAKSAKAKIARLRDQCETLRVLMDDEVTNVDQLTRRIDALFGDDGPPAIILSTVHKAKGLESDNVWMLIDTFNLPAPCECGCWAKQHADGLGACRSCASERCEAFSTDAGRALEEQNIRYVAITRARHRLYRVM